MAFADDDEKFVACTCNVGDSLAYVYSPSQGHVREITQGSHDIQSNRDMRDALGKIKIEKRARSGLTCDVHVKHTLNVTRVVGDSRAVFTTETIRNSELKNAIFKIFALKLVELTSIKVLAKE